MVAVIILAFTCYKMHAMSNKQLDYDSDVQEMALRSSQSTPVIGGHSHVNEARNTIRPWFFPTLPARPRNLHRDSARNMNVRYSIRNATSSQSHL